jgi:hypothetical protein
MIEWMRKWWHSYWGENHYPNEPILTRRVCIAITAIVLMLIGLIVPFIAMNATHLINKDNTNLIFMLVGILYMCVGIILMRRAQKSKRVSVPDWLRGYGKWW